MSQRKKNRSEARDLLTLYFLKAPCERENIKP